MTKYREILRFTALGLSLRNIEKSLHVSQHTIIKVQRRAMKLSLQQDEQKRRATMHILGKLGEQIEIDWAGDPAHLTDTYAGEIIDAYIFIGVMTYSQYTYAETFIDEKNVHGSQLMPICMSFLVVLHRSLYLTMLRPLERSTD